MAITIRNCHYRFLNDKQPVYMYALKRSGQIKDTRFFSRPFYSKERDMVANVLVATIDPTTSLWDMKHILYDTAISHECMRLSQAKEISAVLKMPVVVLINSFCSIQEQRDEHVLFYYDPSLVLYK
jgi:hypothetical protein